MPSSDDLARQASEKPPALDAKAGDPRIEVKRRGVRIRVKPSETSAFEEALELAKEVARTGKSQAEVWEAKLLGIRLPERTTPLEFKFGAEERVTELIRRREFQRQVSGLSNADLLFGSFPGKTSHESAA